MDVERSGSESHDLVPEDNGVHETFEFGNVLTEMDFPRSEVQEIGMANMVI